MKDTTLNNSLFQAEFNTDLQLADVLKFIQSRLDIAETFTDLQQSELEIQLSEIIEANEIGPTDLFDKDILLDSISGSCKDAKETVEKIIERYNIGVFDLFTETQVFDEITDEQIQQQYGLRDF